MAVIVVHPAIAELAPQPRVVVRWEAGHDFESGRSHLLFEFLGPQPIFKKGTLTRHHVVAEAIPAAPVHGPGWPPPWGKIAESQGPQHCAKAMLPTSQNVEARHGDDGDATGPEHAQMFGQRRLHAGAEMLHYAERKQSAVGIVGARQGCDIADLDAQVRVTALDLGYHGGIQLDALDVKPALLEIFDHVARTAAGLEYAAVTREMA